MDTQGNGSAMEQEETAMSPYSMDLRERVAAAVDRQEGSQREISRRFRVSLSFIVRLLQRRRKADTLTPKPHGGGPTPVLSPRDQQRLRQLIDEQNDATLNQLRQRGGFRCSLTTIWRTLRHLGLTYKKKTFTPTNEPGLMCRASGDDFDGTYGRSSQKGWFLWTRRVSTR